MKRNYSKLISVTLILVVGVTLLFSPTPVYAGATPPKGEQTAYAVFLNNSGAVGTQIGSDSSPVAVYPDQYLFLCIQQDFTTAMKDKDMIGQWRTWGGSWQSMAVIGAGSATAWEYWNSNYTDHAEGAVTDHFGDTARGNYIFESDYGGFKGSYPSGGTGKHETWFVIQAPNTPARYEIRWYDSETPTAMTPTVQVDITVAEPPPPPPSSCAYSHKRLIVIDHTKVGTNDSGTLPATGFPVLIELTGDWLRTTTEDPTNGRITDDDGDDIIFKQGSTTLYHEIEEYDGSAATGGKLVAWVRIDSLSKEADTTITMYYRNECVTSPTEDPANVWDDNYVGVWHLSDGYSTAADFYEDSTGTKNGTLTDSDTDCASVDGKISGAFDFAGDNDEDFIEMADFSQHLTTAMSISGWVRPASSSPANFDGFFGVRGGTENDFYVLQLQLSTDLECRFRNDLGASHSANVSSAVSGGSWSYVALTYDGEDLISYVDGQSKTTNPDATGSFSANLYPFRIGGTAAHELDGTVDEVRASKTPRDADWIKTCYNNQSDTAIGEGKFINSLSDEVNCAYSYQRSITINKDKVGTDNSGTLPATGFPVLISLSGDWLKTTTVDSTNGRIENDNGYDIIFKQGSSALYHEIEDYNGTAGTLVAWVRIDSLSKEADSTITMYYGNECVASPTEDPENVWDDNFKGVWHLNQEADGIVTDDLYIDSTSNSNDGDDRIMAKMTR